jgi:hypothetical protein
MWAEKDAVRLQGFLLEIPFFMGKYTFLRDKLIGQ